MWKKSETESGPAEIPSRPPIQLGASTPSSDTATIGPSIAIRGDVSGEENLVVQGRVEGTVNLQSYNVTVGADGYIKADVQAKVVEVKGETDGDLHAEEQVILRRSANVRGNISAPRVTLEDGCKFRGSIDMDMPGEDKSGASAARVAGIKPVSKPAAPKQATGDAPGAASSSQAAVE